MPEIELLDKTELWVVGVELRSVSMPDLAAAAATALSLPRDRVLVTDVRDDRVVFDVLQPRIELSALAGREAALLAALSAVAGVVLADDVRVHSLGVLGVIGTPPEQVPDVLAEASRIADGVRAYVGTRVAVVSTGGEVADGRVRDTNLEAARAAFGPAGYEVVFGGVLPDDEVTIAGRVARLVSDGFGVVLTTGGVGAEDKDRTIEALQLLDLELSTAVLASYRSGHGRHVKDSVRVGVGRIDWATVVALPGPTDEVARALPVVVSGLAERVSAAELAERIAAVLRAPLRQARPLTLRPAARSNPSSPSVEQRSR
ncbi:molybdopterin-binding protein [Cryptosporangium aurantiacum]|uniref:Molybdenum cofactor synthesis domain-containing protein n=1 Tax=Cryptosporangium aurantiacum TaxID=134849 RepID=A0A1M7PEG4_9ACTN|nr:molybdopterin-binding protein [Cryptosporangium aurantiacum]SHN15364.1 molybdenum cofactor synthesis domain-containing protein [Cryptosporangium aurantiacum]